MNNEETVQELETALEEIDDMVNSIAEAIIQIAHGGHDEAAYILYRAMEDHAREEDTLNTYEQFVCITGRNIDD